MENTIRKIIEADHKACKRVRDMEAQRSVVRAEVEAQRAEITRNYKDEMMQRLQAHKEELMEQMQSVRVNKSKEYEETLRTLQDTFAAKKDIWEEAIVKRCLES